MKYIVAEIKGMDVPIIFPDYVEHIDVARKFRPFNFGEAGVEDPVKSAGFVRFTANGTDWDTIICSKVIEVECHGESVSLGKKPVKGDEHLILQAIKKDLN